MAQNPEDNAKPKKRRGPGKPFEKGNRANPGGRPKKTQEDFDLEAACRSHAMSAVETIVKIMSAGQERNQLRASEILLDRGFGKAAQIVTGKDGKDLFGEIKITFVRPGDNGSNG